MSESVSSGSVDQRDMPVDCLNCNRKRVMLSSDTHGACPRCLGPNHALADCPHCLRLPMSLRRSRAERLYFWKMSGSDLDCYPSSRETKAWYSGKPEVKKLAWALLDSECPQDTRFVRSEPSRKRVAAPAGSATTGERTEQVNPELVQQREVAVRAAALAEYSDHLGIPIDPNILELTSPREGSSSQHPVPSGIDSKLEAMEYRLRTSQQVMEHQLLTAQRSMLSQMTDFLKAVNGREGAVPAPQPPAKAPQPAPQPPGEAAHAQPAPVKANPKTVLPKVHVGTAPIQQERPAPQSVPQRGDSESSSSEEEDGALDLDVEGESEFYSNESGNEDPPDPPATHQSAASAAAQGVSGEWFEGCTEPEMKTVVVTFLSKVEEMLISDRGLAIPEPPAVRMPLLSRFAPSKPPPRPNFVPLVKNYQVSLGLLQAGTGTSEERVFPKGGGKVFRLSEEDYARVAPVREVGEFLRQRAGSKGTITSQPGKLGRTKVLPSSPTLRAQLADAQAKKRFAFERFRRLNAATGA
jgi:hypothetical protein